MEQLVVRLCLGMLMSLELPCINLITCFSYVQQVSACCSTHVNGLVIRLSLQVTKDGTDNANCPHANMLW